MRRIVSLVFLFGLGAEGLHAQVASPTPYLAAGSSKERCAALSSWYVKTLEVAGPDAFSPNVDVDQLQKTTARGFVDGVFVPAIGAPYNDLTERQRKKIHGDIGDCSMAPVDDIMRDYMQSAFSDDTGFSMVRGWRTAIPAAQRVAADAASFQNGQARSAAPASAVAQGFVPYAQATTKEQRCAALQAWYERGIALTGPETFGSLGITSSDVTKSFARAFQDDTFPTYFGLEYRDVEQSAGPQMRDDVLTCNTPAVGQWARVVAGAFVWGRGNRDTWLRPIEEQARQLSAMRYASIPERAPLTPAVPAPDKAPGPFDAGNRAYSRILHSDDRVTVGVRDTVFTKCLTAEYTVGIDLPRSEPITAAIAKDVIDTVLAPLATRECPGMDLTINAHFYTRTLSVTHDGEVVPVGSVEITSETELALASYGPGHRQQNAAPTMYYGGINFNYPELASLDGLADYEQRGVRNPAAVAANAPKVETKYVNYTPSEPRGALAALTHARLFQQLANRDFLGIHLDPSNYPTLESSTSAINGLIGLVSLFGGEIEPLDPLGGDTTPPRRGFAYTIEAYSDACRASLGPNPATYTPVWQEKVGEDVDEGMFATIITEHWQTMIGKTVYMEPAYRDLYAKSVRTEKAIILREMFKLRDELGLDQLLAGEASIRPLLVIKEYQDDAAAFLRTAGCETGKTLLRNWADFVNEVQPPARPNGDYPMVVEHKEDKEGGPDQVAVAIGEVPPSEAPFYPYTEGTWLFVQYYGDRQGGLHGYYVSHFNLLFLPGRVQTALFRPESNELLQSFGKDGLRMINCFYDEGTANYWLEGYPQPNESQKQAVGAAFRGSAPRCPARWPG